MHPWTVLSPVLAAVATGLVAYLSRGRRIPRGLHAAVHTFKTGRHLVWTNTNWVLYSFIVAGVSFNLYQAQQLRLQSENTQAALCSYRSDLKRRLAASENELAFPHIFGLSPIAVQALEITVNGEKQAIHALSHLGCP